MIDTDIERLKKIENQFKFGDYWGISTGLNLSGCDLDLMKDEKHIKSYNIALCDDVLQMKRYQDPILVHFGSGNKEGYTLVQLIETSCVVIHFANEKKSTYIDIFSCKAYDPHAVLEFSKAYFLAEEGSLHFTFRK